MNAITVCVGYDDYLRRTLPFNRQHFGRVLVVTSLEDKETELRAQSYGNDVCPYATNAFYHEGAKFNKGRALEEGFDILGREGWIMVIDADVVLPEKLDPGPRGWERGCIYSPQRRLCLDAENFTPSLDWATLPYGPEKDVFPFEFAGYCQVFHASAAAWRPWYGINCPTAQGCDSEFYYHWPEHKRVRPDFEVLHLGPLRENWAGRVSPRID